MGKVDLILKKIVAEKQKKEEQKKRVKDMLERAKSANKSPVLVNISGEINSGKMATQMTEALKYMQSLNQNLAARTMLESARDQPYQQPQGQQINTTISPMITIDTKKISEQISKAIESGKLPIMPTVVTVPMPQAPVYYEQPRGGYYGAQRGENVQYAQQPPGAQAGPGGPVTIIREREIIHDRPGEVEEEAKKLIKQPDKYLADWQVEDLSKYDETYTLIEKNGKPMAQAHIYWKPDENLLVYDVVEPKLEPQSETVFKKLKDLLIDKLEVEFTLLSKIKAEEYIMKNIEELIDFYGLKLSPEQREIVEYYLLRDFIGLDVVEPLMRDTNIEDISCDGIGIPLYIYHRNPHYSSLRTQTVFKDKETLNSFVMKLGQRCGRSISVAEPLLDGTLPDGSRVQATYGSDISRKGSSFTIRRFLKDPITPIDLILYGTVNYEMLAYIWLAIEHGKSALISGATATGKTSMLNSISLFIRQDAKIVSIEDTAELQMPHENWLPQVTRVGFGVAGPTGSKLGEVTMFDLLKASLRQRPDYIVVGEVRGQEAAVLFQEMATGHPGLSTMHADSMEAVLNRLETPPISLPPSLLQNLDLVIILVREKVKGAYVRRVAHVIEIMGFDLKTMRPITNEVFGWVPAKDRFVYTAQSHMLGIIMQERGANEESIAEELQRRITFLRWLTEHKVRDFRQVSSYINKYYKDPERTLKDMGVF